MARGRLAVHAHFYQPLRVDPFSGQVPPDPSAAPFRDWNTRIDAECYRPIAQRGTLAHVSFDVGPTLAGWMEEHAPVSYRGFVTGDADEGRATNAMAQGFHHAILPLASAADRRTEIRWGLADFRHRFGRPAEGFWLPETAVDLPTLRALADEGVRYTILAPWQADQPGLDTRRPYRVDVGGGRSIVVAFYDGGLSASVSFEPSATSDADRFARDRVATRLAGSPTFDGQPPLVVIATDGELYGHHQQFRDLFLHRLVTPGASTAGRGFDVVDLGRELVEPPGHPFPTARIAERTSWSCHHGVARWTHECPDAHDGRWKGPLRAALERLAAGVDAVTEAALRRLPGELDPWAARDDYARVVIGAEERAAFVDRWLPSASDERREVLAQLLEAQRWRLAMFASDGWFWDDPIRPETRHVLRFAGRAARLADAVAGSHLERRLVADLSLFVSPGRGLDGSAIYRQALSEVGQPGPG
jgi:Domain of unknown function (DUF3536)/Glycosyl hydrolase family 57